MSLLVSVLTFRCCYTSFTSEFGNKQFGQHAPESLFFLYCCSMRGLFECLFIVLNPLPVKLSSSQSLQGELCLDYQGKQVCDRLHNLSRQPVPVLSHPPSKAASCCSEGTCCAHTHRALHPSLLSSSHESKGPKLTSARHNGTSSGRILSHFHYIVLGAVANTPESSCLFSFKKDQNPIVYHPS